MVFRDYGKKLLNFVSNLSEQVLIVVIASVLIPLLLTSYLLEPPSSSLKSETFASFDDGKGNINLLTDFYEEWGTFGDSYIYARSVTFWSVNETFPGSNNYAMWMDVTLDHPNSTYSPYTGVFAYMSPPPHRARDLSDYNFIDFDFGVSKLDGNIDAYIQLVDLQTRERAWHVVKLKFDNPDQDSVPRMKPYHLDLSGDFNPPEWYKKEKDLPLDTKHIYKVAILFTSKTLTPTPSHGVFVIDNIRFSK